MDIKNCFYVGDDVENDMIPCVKAGMTGLWIDRANDGREYKDFKKIKDLKEISGFLSKNRNILSIIINPTLTKFLYK